MRMSRIGAFAAAAVAAMAIPPLVATANAHGGGVGGHFGSLRADHFRGVFGIWPFYGAPADYSPYVMGYPAPRPVVYVLQQPAPRCHPSQEVVTVPAEAGGTRDITIRRCTAP